jgi:2-polyprenyl-3-methyl-5-hydroxy-6-metoxy-1,4-benzoquinol methylase
MSKTVAEHYARHLAPIYVWMAGGAEPALQAGAAELEALRLPLKEGAVAIDLGAGFGKHAIPLARQGVRVTAIDSSVELLHELVQLAGNLPIRAVQDDLLAFRSHIEEAPSLFLCMGDTLTHLPDLGAVEELIAGVSTALPAGGTFIVTMRDYSVPLLRDQRFILVRSDDSRILTCFLEYEAESVLVHDIILSGLAEDGRQRSVTTASFAWRPPA